ncbi:MAG: hypothetical protein JST40_07305 [Armatimonadetes bacterium]|nr:hypothetical protein [Armatimonadota bacterium]
MKKLVCLVLATLVSSACFALGEFNVTDITAWTQAQRAALPNFHWFTFTNPAGVFSFWPTTRSPLGVYTGEIYDTWSGYEQARVYGNGTDATVQPFGVFYWSYWSGDDYHWGSSSWILPDDANDRGTMVGRSIMPGYTNNPQVFAQVHGFVRDGYSGQIKDMTPNADQARVSGVNNRGEFLVTEQGSVPEYYYRTYRVNTDGTHTEFDGVSAWDEALLGPDGTVIGLAYEGVYIQPVATEPTGGGSTYTFLHPINTLDRAVVTGMNGRGWVVGYSYNYATLEYFPTMWERSVSGTWKSYDLNDYHSTSWILDQVKGVADDGTIVATAHPDGTDNWQSNWVMLKPSAAHSKVQGHLDLQDFLGAEVMAYEFEVTAEVWNTSMTVLKDKITVPIDAQGNFQLWTPITGATKVRLKVGHWLSSVVSATLSSSTPATVAPTFLNGDVDEDNAVTIFDYSALSDAFDSTRGAESYRLGADLDGDGYIGIFDYVILSQNFDKAGA